LLPCSEFSLWVSRAAKRRHMDEQELLSLLTQNISFQLRHAHYDRTVQVGYDCHMMTTGKGQEKEVLKYRRFEAEPLKKQRLRLNNPITPVFISEPDKMFDKMTRVDGVRKDLVTSSEKDKADLHTEFWNFQPGKDIDTWLVEKYKDEEEDDAWGNKNTKAEIWAEHGAWSYLKMRRSEMASDNKALASELRKYPFTVEEAFRPSVGSAIIDPLICGNAMADLCRIQPDGRTFSDHIVKRGNIDGVPGNYYFTESKQGVYEVSVRFLEFMEREELKEKVHRQSKPAGRNSLEPENEKTRPYSFNDIQQSPQGWRPATKRGFIGLDPIDMDKKHRQTSKLSDMAAVAFWCYDIDIDGETYRDGGAREMLSNSFVARYRHRHASKTTDFQNVLKLAMWLGYEIHFEMNRGESFRDYLIAMDAIFFKAKSPLEAHLRKRTANSRGAPPVDTYTSEFVHQKGTEKIQLWVEEFGSALTCPFIETWQEFMIVDLKDMEPFDEYVAVEYALLKGAPGIISQAEKKSHIATKPKAAPGGSVYEAFY